MLLTRRTFHIKKLYYVVIFLLLNCIGNAKPETNETSKVENANKTQMAVPEQKSVKKELKVNITDEGIMEITPPSDKDERHNGKLIIIDEKSVIESSGKPLEQKTLQTDGIKADFSETSTKDVHLRPQHRHHAVDQPLSLSDDDISESLKAGFYFFLILSSGAVAFILFKIYRLRLSRAERKYGVQGDRSTQELTPLPTSLEEGHSDDEDQTLFDIQHHNIRIL